ncbi:hypothetical protein BH10BAC1_BH10BAC1_18350 [soil metagenome]
MNKKGFHIKAHYILALFIAFTLPFARFTAIGISLMLLNWLIEADFKNKFSQIASSKFALLFLAFFIWHLMGLFYTQNMDAGWFDIQVKLSLFIFPLVICSRPFDAKQIKNFFFAMILGIILSSLALLSIATYTYFTTTLIRFFYQEFSLLVHPSYISMYINVCISWLLLSVFRGEFKGTRFNNFLAILVVTFLSFINVLLSSKMGLITMVFVFIGFIIYYIVNRKKYIIGVASILLLAGSIFLAMKLFPEMAGRVTRSITAISNPPSNPADTESTAVRFFLWGAANQVISEHLIFGTGTGDSKDVLLKEYEKRGMTGAKEHKLNTHSEYYQVFVTIGLIGFILLIACLLFPLFKAFTSSNVIYILFLLIIILNFFPESMLETQAGVIFYAFFNSVLCFGNDQLILKDTNT